MRDIRYRAWDKSQNLLIDWETIRGNIGWYLDDDDIELMQYTGLKDKNGKEIYEGDILEYGFYDDLKRLYEIYFDRGYSGYRMRVSGNRGHSDFNSGVSSSFEIIGNIYENPNLLITK